MAVNRPWLDRAIGLFAPGVALQRAKARAQIDILSRKYDGAATGRLTDGWITGNTSADAEIWGAGSKLRDRSRDLIRNNPHAAKAKASWVSSIVGDGITPRSSDKKALALFNKWAAGECDAENQLDFYGMQTLACGQMVEAGEVLVRRRRRLPQDNLSVPIQIQLIEADLLDDSRTGAVMPGNSNTSVLGIEFDAIGRRTAYWMFAQHPGTIVLINQVRLLSAPVPASEIIHLYEKQRTQVRGVPWFAPVMRKLRDLDDWEAAELIRKKIEACAVGVVTTVDDDDSQIGAVRIEDTDGNPVDRFEPGQFLIARGGKDIKFNTPGTVGGAAEYKKLVLHDIAAGVRLPYELISGDLSDVNFSSIRAGLNEFRRLVRSVQNQIFIPIFCQGVWDWFMDAAFLAGLVNSPSIPVTWSAPKFEWVDPEKDAMAEILAIRAGTRTWDEVVHERGGDPDEQLKEIAARNKAFDAAGIILDSDPRMVSKTGIMQPTAEPPDVPDAAPVAPAAPAKAPVKLIGGTSGASSIFGAK